MVTVALIGADGAGKTTVALRLEEETSLRVKYIYMGVNPDASNHALPTTRLVQKVRRWRGKETHAGGPPDRARRKTREQRLTKRTFSRVKSALRLVNQLGEEWYRQWLAWYYQRRGYVVLFDRHFYSDYYAHDICDASEDQPLSRRIHGFLLNKLYPRPDLVILLDAPAPTLFARKSEGTVELLEERRQEYFQLRDLVPNFSVVNADQSPDAVVDEVLLTIRQFRDRNEKSA